MKVTIKRQPRDPVTNEPLPDREDLIMTADRIAIQYRRSGCDRSPMMGVFAGQGATGWQKPSWFDATETILIVEQTG